MVLGRPLATTHAEIESAAFRLFAEHGFEQTTLEAIATEVGVGRRTLFRYYASKNDIPWGRFDRTLVHFRELLAAQPPSRTTARCSMPWGVPSWPSTTSPRTPSPATPPGWS